MKKMNERNTRLISFTILTLILFITFIFKNQFSGGKFTLTAGIVIMFIGIIVWIAGKISLGKKFTIQYSPKGLVTSGIYSKVRHPLYLGGFLTYLGLGLYFRSIIGLALILVVVLPLFIYSAVKEENLLIGKYGEKYQRYKKKTII
tara:strand:- start:69 stop:506 length:438 start_codon:yes stop_codon:yes gene_type:complete